MDTSQMMQVQCVCGQKIEVVGAVAGYRRRFPQEIYLCQCGVAYLPEDLGCMGVGLLGLSGINDDNFFQPTALSPVEYRDYKREELEAATRLNIASQKAIIEIMAKVI